MSTKIQVIDISLGGVLFECSERVPIGARGTVRLNLGGLPLIVELQVSRVSVGEPDQSTYRVAGSYVNMTAVHRRLIDRFVSA